MTPYQRLLSPLELGSKTVRNRIVSTPHATGWELPGGLISNREADYLIRKAKGGAGLVMTFGSASVDPTTAASYGAVALWDERNEPQLRRMAEEIHAQGSLLISQATHMGNRASSKNTFTPVRGVSTLPEPDHREVSVPLTKAELQQLIQRYVAVAQRLERCGWDGIEITSFAHLIGQFWNPAFNDRTDEYGGSLDNRMRFGKEVVAAVNAETSSDFLVGFRMSLEFQTKTRDFEIHPNELKAIAIEMANTGDIDMLSVTVGDAMNNPGLSVAMGSDFIPPATAKDVAAQLAPEIEIPLLVTGRILTGETAEELLESNAADLVGMTRAIIADPDMPQKLAAGERVRECIGINQGCIGRLYSGYPIICSVNPAIRTPELENLEPSEHARKIVVVGAGAAGLEAAKHAAKRGHEVVIIEQEDVVGGRARINADYGWRPNWRKYLDYIESELQELGVQFQFRAKATADAVLALDPDSVIIATGSRLRQNFLSGSALNVIDSDRIVVRAPQPNGNNKALIIDEEAHMVAPNAAEVLGKSGWEVTVATPLRMLGGEIDSTLIPVVHQKLAPYNPQIIPNVRALNAQGSAVVLENVMTGEISNIEDIGLLVVSGHRESETDLLEELLQRAPELEVQRVGDAHAPRDLDAATDEGAHVGANIG